MCCYRIHARIWGEDSNLLNSHSKVTENTSKYATPPPPPNPKANKNIHRTLHLRQNFLEPRIESSMYIMDDPLPQVS